MGSAWLIVNRRVIGSRLGGRLTGRRGMAVVAVAIGVVVVAALAVGPAMLDRFLNAGDGGRPSYFAAATRMWQDAPLLGHGPGTWAAERVAWLAPTDLDYVVPHAHDVYLQTLAELGLAGLLLGAIAIASVLWLVLRALRSPGAQRRAWAWATLLVGGYLAVVDVVDFYANLPGLLLVAVIPIALLDGWSDRGIGVPAALRPALRGPCRDPHPGGRLRRLAGGPRLGGIDRPGPGARRGGCGCGRLADRAGPRRGRRGGRPRANPRTSSRWPWPRCTRATGRRRGGPTARRWPRMTCRRRWLGLALATLEAGGPPEEVVSALGAAMRVGPAARPHQPRGRRDVYDRLGMAADADQAYVDALVSQPALAADPAWGSHRAPGARFAPSSTPPSIERDPKGGGWPSWPGMPLGPGRWPRSAALPGRPWDRSET